MKRDYLALWGLLAIAFVIFLTLSMCDDFNVGALKIKTPKVAWLPKSNIAEVTPQETADSVVSGHLHQVTLDRGPKCVLMIGDSMVEGLAPRLAAYCNASNDSVYAVIWYSATTELYGEARLISDYIRVLKPDFIFLSLGGNELFVKDVAEKRDKYVKAILQEIGDIPYVWIGPPNWKPDTGINDLISSNVPDGCFFTSNGMEFERKRDGAHPTNESAIVWMDSITRWMPQHSHYVLPLSSPKAKTKRPVKYFLHMPGELTHRP